MITVWSLYSDRYVLAIRTSSATILITSRSTQRVIDKSSCVSTDILLPIFLAALSFQANSYKPLNLVAKLLFTCSNIAFSSVNIFSGNALFHSSNLNQIHNHALSQIFNDNKYVSSENHICSLTTSNVGLSSNLYLPSNISQDFFIIFLCRDFLFSSDNFSQFCFKNTYKLLA